LPAARGPPCAAPANTQAPDEFDPTREYQVSPAQGPWMICTISYSGPAAPTDAVQMVRELRTTYKLPAYIFNYGAEAKKQERERVERLKQQQREYIERANMFPNPQDVGAKIASQMRLRIKSIRIEEQCAVLIGGFKDADAANSFLKKLKKLKTPDPTKVKMSALFVANPKETNLQLRWVSPFV